MIKVIQQFSKKWYLILVIILGVIIGVSYGVFRNGGWYFAIWQDNKEIHCDQMPNWSQAQKIFQENNATIEQIKNINPGMVFVELREACPNKGEVVIYYDTIQTRNQIKALIGDSFFGIPYVMYNI